MSIPRNSALGRQVAALADAQAGRPPRVAAAPQGGEPLPAALVAAVRAAGFPEPEPEFRFALPGRLWRFDWAWPAYGVAFERDGGTFAVHTCRGCGKHTSVFRSRHHDREGLEADLDKFNAAAILGWLVVRATPRQVRDGRAARDLVAALESRRDGGRGGT